MKNSFSLLAFLCKVPLDLLEEYSEQVGLSETEMGSCIPWEILNAYDISRRNMAIIRQAILDAPEQMKNQIMQDFLDIDELADGRGIEYLISTGKQHDTQIDLTTHFSHYDGSHAKALFALMEFPDIFKSALRFAHVESLGESRWHKTARIENAKDEVNDNNLKKLQLAISNHCHLQGRGAGCEIDFEDRGDDLYVFVYPEDYTCRHMVYNDKSDLIVESYRPAFEIIYIYHRPAQTLEIYSNVGTRDRDALKKFFGRAILGVELGNWSNSRKVYNLEHLKYSTSTFPVSPADEVVAVKLKRLCLLDMTDVEKRELVLASQCKYNNNDVYEFLEKVITDGRVSLSQLEVSRVSFQLIFKRRQDKGRQITRTFTLAAPNTHTFKRNDPFALKILELLKRWKIDVAHENYEFA